METGCCFGHTHSQTLILPARANRRQHIPSEEKQQKQQMEVMVALGVKNRQANQADRAKDAKNHRKDGQRLLAARVVGDEAAVVAQPARGQHRGVEENADDAGPRDEEGLEDVGANVGDVDNLDVRVLVVVGPVVVVDDPVEEHAEEHADPDEGGDDGEPLGGISMDSKTWLLVFRERNEKGCRGWTYPVGDVASERHCVGCDAIRTCVVGTSCARGATGGNRF